MRVGVFRGEETDERVNAALDAFTQGLAYLGVDHFTSFQYVPCDVAVVWGISSLKFPHTSYRDFVREQNPNTIVLERGFVKLDKYYAAGWGDTGGRADFCNDDVPADRWNRLGIKLKPWKEDGDYILILGQIPWDTSVQHTDYVKWVCNVIDLFKQQTSDPIVFRNHPLLSPGLGPFDGAYASTGSLEKDLEGAAVAVTMSSTSAVDACIAGVEVAPADMRCMVPPGRLMEREKWAHALAYCQWRLHEFEKGLAFKHLVEGRGL